MIALDTHALVWWVNGDSALSRAAGQAIERERKRRGEIVISSISACGRFHKDPADRLIVALARTLSAPLVTSDRRIRSYRHVKTIW